MDGRIEYHVSSTTRPYKKFHTLKHALCSAKDSSKRFEGVFTVHYYAFIAGNQYHCVEAKFEKGNRIL